MNWIELEYPNIIYIVEVKYSSSIAIAQARCKDEPKEKDTAYGFTSNFRSYETAKRYAITVSKELNIPFPY